MGMFDYVKVETPLAGFTGILDVEFQTKDFECLLHTYVISSNGEIYREEWDYEWVDEPDSLLGGYAKKNDDSYRRIHLTNLNDVVIFHGKVAGKWRDYIATFEDGKLISMTHSDVEYKQSRG